MFDILIENKLLTAIILLLLLLSIICQIIIGVIYQKLINETESISTTENKHLKLCKLKFANCYMMNGGIANISVFVDKFINRLKVIHISLSSMAHISGQFILLSVLASGIGICRAIIAGETLLRLLPFYFVSMLCLYLYFAVSGLVDIQGRKNALKINLMDYLENHMLSRLVNNITEEEALNEKENLINEARERRKEKKIKGIKIADKMDEALNTREALITEKPEEAKEVKGLHDIRDNGIKLNGELAENIVNIINKGAEKGMENYHNGRTPAKAVFAEEELEDLLRELLV